MSIVAIVDAAFSMAASELTTAPNSATSTNPSSHRADGHDRAGEGIEAVLEELGHRVDAAAQEGGQEDERHHDQRDGRHPLVARDGEAEPVGGLPAHAHELLGGDVAAMSENPISHHERPRPARK